MAKNRIGAGRGTWKYVLISAVAVAAAALGLVAPSSAMASRDIPPTTAGVAGSSAVQSEIDALVRTKGATQISRTAVSWYGGSVILDVAPVQKSPTAVAGVSAAASSLHGCPSGWYCFYQYSNFGGRRLQFHDCSAHGTLQYFSTYSFSKATSSWVNNRTGQGEVDVYQSNGQILWFEFDGRTSDAYLSSYEDNKATFFYCFTR